MRTSSPGHRIAALVILFLGLCLPEFSEASLKRGPKIRWLGDRPSAAQAGREFVGQVEIVAPKPGRLEGIEVSGAGWSVRGIDAPAFTFMGGGDRRVVTFRVVPQDPAQPLTIRASFDGIPFEKTIRLDAASLEKKRRIQFRDQAGPKLSGSRPRLSPGTTQRAMDTELTFRGDFQYQRGDGQWVGADNIIVKIWDDDSPDPFDEVIWSGTTNPNGHFEGWVIWDDCDISGCDDPDIYLEIITTGQVADVQQDDLLETTWSWETDVIGDFTGNDIDFGLMTPGSDPDGNAAVHIFNSMVRAHRFASNRHGMTAAPLDVLWPDENDGTHYNQFFEEIHIARVRTWNELSHTHEFAHHLHNEFGNLLGNDYENGYCDTPDPGHCVWCPESVGDAWQEGFANWYGQVVTEDYPVTYSQTPWAAGTTNNFFNEDRYGRDWVGRCEQDSVFYPGALTEGYVMALLRDMADPYAPTTDDHDGDGTLDCDTDGMDAGTDEIMTVFRDDDPTDMTMFLNSFRNRYLSSLGQDLWSATRNVDSSFGFPLPDPAVVSQPQACKIARVGENVTFQVTGNGSLLQYQWRKDGVNLSDNSVMSGTTTTNLMLSPVGLVSSGSYDCVVRTCDGTKQVTSAAAKLTVFARPPEARPYLTWGENYAAQCGNGTNVVELPPGSYTGLTDVVQAEGGRSFSIALKADGTVYTWGRTEGGELGNGFGWNNYVHSPAAINLSDVIQITAGNSHAAALLRDGTIRAWGWNFYGQLGDTTQIDRLTPHWTAFPGCFTAISGGHAHTLALRSDGTVWGAGFNTYGALGNGTSQSMNPYPVQAQGLTDVVAIRAAGYSSFALRSDGTVWAWGYNAYANLGTGNFDHSLVPVQVPGLSGITAISASINNTYAIKNTGEVYAWGRGDMGGIGNASGAWQLSPVVIPGLTNIRKIDTGDGGWTMALLQDNTLRAWGYNANLVLGTGAINGSYQYTPQPVLGVFAATNIGAGTATAHVMGHLGGVTTAVESEPSEPAPLKLALRVAPVPSRSSTSLAFDLPKSGRVSIAVYDVSGRLVRTIVSEPRPAGWHRATWDGRSRSGLSAPAGVYFARLEREGEVLTRRIVLVR